MNIARFLRGISLAALAAGAIAVPTGAATYTVATEEELRQAIIDANASGDASSTITLAGNITVTDPALLSAATMPLTFDTGAFALSGVSGTGITDPGSTGLAITSGPVTFVGSVTGGNAAAANSRGVGGIGLSQGGGTLNNQGTIVGGIGGNTALTSPAGRTAGRGGVGAALTDTALVNEGQITGGAGGSYNAQNNSHSGSSAAAGAGGAGVTMTGGALDNRSVITGGAGGEVGNYPGNGDNIYGGAGGVGASLSGGTHSNSGTIRGAQGGIGRNQGATGHGASGNGAALSGGAHLTNSGSIVGANGRSGGGSNAGSGRLGGTGITLNNAVLDNQGGQVRGGSSGLTTGSTGGGNAVAGSGRATVINNGTLTGGTNTGGSLGPAVQFSGTDSRLELRSASVINGAAIGGVTDTLALGGSVNSSFNVSNIGASAQYRGFGIYEKVGSSLWTLTGATTAVTPWTLTEGILSVSADAMLGNASGALTFNGGTLQVTGTSFADTARPVVWGVPGGNFDIVEAGHAFTVGQDLTAGGALGKQGAGTLILAGTNDYTGGTTIAAGTLQIGNGGTTGSIEGDVANNGALVFNRSDAVTLDGVVSGTGSLLQSGTGTTILTGNNTYTSGTTIAAGTLQLGNGGTSGSILGNVTNNGDALAFNRSDIVTFAGVISGSGAVNQIGTGTTILTATHTYAGGTTISAGALQLGNDGTTGSIVGDVANDGTLAFHRSNAVTFAGLISGTGSIEQAGAGTTTLTANNSYTGTTTISAGILQLGNGGATGGIVGGGDVVNNGTLVFNRSNDVTFSGLISGTGGAQQMGAAATILTADNSYTGGTTVAGGSLLLGDGGATGSIVGNVVLANGSQLGFDRSNLLTLDGLISGNGGITQLGTGTTILTGANSYSGVTTVASGTLRINGDQSAAMGTTLVTMGATLGGSGTIGGQVMGGGTIAPGNDGPGTLTINGDLTLASGARLDYEFGVAGVVGGPLNDLINVGGDLTLDGTIDVRVTPSGSFGPGIYRVINYDGVLNDAGLALGAMPASSAVAVQTSIDKQVNLVNTTGYAFRYWDAVPGGKDDGTLDGGTGVWQNQLTGDNWTQNPDAALNAPYSNRSFAVFAATAGIITVDNSLSAVEVAGMQFASDGYVITGDPILLADVQPIIRVGDGTMAGDGISATIASEILGTDGLIKTDRGTLILTADNGYTGGTTIEAGTLQLGDGGTTGSLVGDVVNDGTLSFNRSNYNIFAGQISGTGALVIEGSGVTVLTGSNSYTGGTTITDGRLQIGGGGTIGSITGDVVNNSHLDFDRADDVTFAGTISGSGAVHQNGAGALILTGANSYLGDTEVDAGPLLINGDQSGATGLTNVHNDAILGGAGTIGGDVALGSATLAPGAALGAIGTLTINGGLSLASASQICNWVRHMSLAAR